MNNFKSINFFRCLPLIALVSTSVLAQSEPTVSRNGYLGVLLGGNRTANSDGKLSDANTTPTMGLTLGTKLTSNFGVGLFGSYFGQTSSGTFLGLPVGSAASTTMLLGQGNFFLGGLHLGGEAGSAISSWSGNISTLHDGSSVASLVFGPEAGFDFKITELLSLGGELHYLFSSQENVVNNVQALASLKVWL